MSFSYDWSSMSAMIALVFFLIAVILFVLAISFYSNTNLWISFGVFVILSPIIFLSGSDKN
jgi:intracellular septation protein A